MINYSNWWWLLFYRQISWSLEAARLGVVIINLAYLDQFINTMFTHTTIAQRWQLIGMHTTEMTSSRISDAISVLVRAVRGIIGRHREKQNVSTQAQIRSTANHNSHGKQNIDEDCKTTKIRDDEDPSSSVELGTTNLGKDSETLP